MRACCLVAVLVIASKALAETSPSPPPLPSEELLGGATTASDGFFVKIESDVDKDTPGDLVWFLLAVPRKVGTTEFSMCQLQTLDWRGRVVLSVSLAPRGGDPSRKERYVDFWGERAVAKRCRILFTYGQPPMGDLVKEYVFPLTDHLPRRK